jgi:hypothetical protein
MMPERMSMLSNSGQLCMNSWYWASVQKPITRSTPARLYQLRSKEDEFAGGGQVRNVALEVPLGLFAFGGRAQSDDAADAWVQGLGDALDGAALAGGVAALKEDDDLQLLVLDPLLQLHEFNLQARLLGVVVDVFADAQGDRGHGGDVDGVVDLGSFLLFLLVGTCAFLLLLFGHKDSSAMDNCMGCSDPVKQR